MPFLGSLRRTLTELRPISPTARALVESLVERGGTEGLLRFFYNAALATSRYDQTSHVFPAHLVAGLCGLYRSNEPPVEGCHGRFTTTGVPSSSKAAGQLRSGATGSPQPGATPVPGTPAAPVGGSGEGGAPLPNLPSLPKQPKLPNLPSLPALPALPNLNPNAPGGGGQGSNAINDLLDFLLGK
jgi:hypothetical protein